MLKSVGYRLFMEVCGSKFEKTIKYSTIYLQKYQIIVELVRLNMKSTFYTLAKPSKGGDAKLSV